jgi:hypothetical protein
MPASEGGHNVKDEGSAAEAGWSWFYIARAAVPLWELLPEGHRPPPMAMCRAQDSLCAPPAAHMLLCTDAVCGCRVLVSCA